MDSSHAVYTDVEGDTEQADPGPVQAQVKPPRLKKDGTPWAAKRPYQKLQVSQLHGGWDVPALKRGRQADPIDLTPVTNPGHVIFVSGRSESHVRHAVKVHNDRTGLKLVVVPQEDGRIAVGIPKSAAAQSNDQLPEGEA